MASTLGVQRATVVSTQDPAGKGRLRLRIPQLFGDTPTDWVEPSIPGGMIPAPGTTVWVMFLGGDAANMVYISGSPTPDLSAYATIAMLSSYATTAAMAAAIAPLAVDANVVHLAGAGTEVITGSKRFVANVLFGSATTQSVNIQGGTGSHGIEIGRTDGVASTPYIDFHSGATATDYDTRIWTNNGTGSSGGGQLNFVAGDVRWNGTTLATTTDTNDNRVLSLMGVL